MSSFGTAAYRSYIIEGEVVRWVEEKFIMFRRKLRVRDVGLIIVNDFEAGLRESVVRRFYITSAMEGGGDHANAGY